MKAYMPENGKWDFGLLGHQQTLDAWQGKGQHFQTGRENRALKEAIN